MSAVLIRFNISGLDLTNEKATSLKIWRESIQALIATAPKTSNAGCHDIYAHDVDHPDEILLALHERTEESVRESLSPLDGLLQNPAMISSIPLKCVIMYPSRHVQQTDFYAPAGGKWNPEELSWILDTKMGRWQRRCVVRDFRHGKVTGNFDDPRHSESKSRVWSAFTIWPDATTSLPTNEGGRTGDSAILEAKSLKKTLDGTLSFAVSMEERNWVFEPLEVALRQEPKTWCVLM